MHKQLDNVITPNQDLRMMLLAPSLELRLSVLDLSYSIEEEKIDSFQGCETKSGTESLNWFRAIYFLTFLSTCICT